MEHIPCALCFVSGFVVGALSALGYATYRIHKMLDNL